jgi:DNA-binding response OmpR family regulator
MKLLIVEDEADLVSSFLTFAQKEKYQADVSINYREAAERISLYDYDCILLDINLPDGNGLQLLEHLKSINKKNGVIIISARNSLDDKIIGLNLGADDYLTKPFHLSELNARIQAVIRRKKFDAPHSLSLANVHIDLNVRIVKIDEHVLNLTKKEFDILQHLVANKNRVVTKNSLAEYIWGDYVDNADSFDFLFQHLKNLKKKLKQDKAMIEVKNVYGVGYQLVEI